MTVRKAELHELCRNPARGLVEKNVYRATPARMDNLLLASQAYNGQVFLAEEKGTIISLIATLKCGENPL